MTRTLFGADGPPSRVRPRSHTIRKPRPRRVRGGGLRPPGDSGTGGRGGGGGGGGGPWGNGNGPDDPQPAPQPGETPAGTSKLGVQLALGAIAALFFVFLVALVVLRSSAKEWPPSGARMPAGLWVSTGFLLASSLAMQAAQAAARRPDCQGLPLRLFLAAAFGCAFLATQAWIWTQLDHAGRTPSGDLYLALFYAATLVHALHVLGGVLILLRQAFGSLRRPASTDAIGLAALYWHFMGLVWLFVFAIVWGPL